MKPTLLQGETKEELMREAKTLTYDQLAKRKKAIISYVKEHFGQIETAPFNISAQVEVIQDAMYFLNNNGHEKNITVKIPNGDSFVLGTINYYPEIDSVNGIKGNKIETDDKSITFYLQMHPLISTILKKYLVTAVIVEKVTHFQSAPRSDWDSNGTSYTSYNISTVVCEIEGQKPHTHMKEHMKW